MKKIFLLFLAVLVSTLSVKAEILQLYCGRPGSEESSEVTICPTHSASGVYQFPSLAVTTDGDYLVSYSITTQAGPLDLKNRKPETRNKVHIGLLPVNPFANDPSYAKFSNSSYGPTTHTRVFKKHFNAGDEISVWLHGADYLLSGSTITATRVE